jgi:hypothetical protein
LTAGDATDTFSWSPPQNNGLAITKYGYQTTTDNGSTWSSETEVLSTSAILNTQYSLSSFKIRVRAFNAAGWGEYSNASSGTVAWTNVTGTDTQTDTVCGPDGCSETDTDTVCGPAGCSESQSQNCECGTQSRSRTRTSSRTRTRTRTSSRTRTRTTQQYTRPGSTSSTITYGSYGAYTSYTYSAWSAYSAYSDYTYSAWSAYSAFSSCAGGSYSNGDFFGRYTCSNGLTYEGGIFGFLRVPYGQYNCPTSDYLEGVDNITICSTTGTAVAGNLVCVIPSI